MERAHKREEDRINFKFTVEDEMDEKLTKSLGAMGMVEPTPTQCDQV
jgi:hypothetical protein